jgi:DUF4097 and DUF4098 domain-containing protein YvlB
MKPKRNVWAGLTVFLLAAGVFCAAAESETMSEAESVNGSVKCGTSTSSAKESIKISTVNGSVELKLPASTNADLKAGAVNGSIKSELAFSETNVSGSRKVRATIGEGGLPVDLCTGNGSMQIRKAGAVKGASRQPRIELELN